MEETIRNNIRIIIRILLNIFISHLLKVLGIVTIQKVSSQRALTKMPHHHTLRLGALNATSK